MTVKEYLQQAYRLNELIERDLEEVTLLRQMATALPSAGAAPLSGGSGTHEARFERTVEKLIDLERKIDAEIDRYIDLRTEIRTVIAAVPRMDERLLLQYRYLDFLPFEQIGDKMHFSPSQIYRLHNAGLILVRDVIHKSGNPGAGGIE